VVLTGGTAKLPGAVDLAKNILALPAQAGFPVPMGGLVDKVDDPSFATVVGLILWELDNLNFKRKGGIEKSRIASTITGSVGTSVDSMRRWFGKFLP
jgi:cell division protein FtsA